LEKKSTLRWIFFILRLLIRLTKLAQDGWVFQGADVLRNFLAFGQAAQQAAHDFP
jgi:hypothetical protein